MSDPVHTFFSQWDIYRLCIEHNTLFHREVGAILHRELLARPGPFTFLDLACGDADLTSRALRGTEASSYAGVDFTAPALALATGKIAELRIPCTLHENDFTDFLRTNNETFDAIYLGLSLHHLAQAAKRETMEHLRRAVAPGGTFHLFEPVLHGGETREGYVDRWIAAMDGPYEPFPPTARTALRDHVRASERPESTAEYLAAAEVAGFTGGEILFTDPDHFYSLFRFQA